MNPEPEMPNANVSSDNLPSTEEFGLWLKSDPAHMLDFVNIIKQHVEKDDGKLPREFVDKARGLIRTAKLARDMGAIQQKMKMFQELIQRPGGTMAAEDRLAQANAILDELTDDMLELPEPHRTRFLEKLLPMREKLRAIRIE